MKMTDIPSRVSDPEDRRRAQGLLGRQDGGRLVEDQDLRPSVERLQDLDPLLLADRDVLHEGVRVDGEAEAILRRSPTRAVWRRA